jgi:hypothetical protein
MATETVTPIIDIPALVARAEAHVEQHPYDALCLALLVPVYLELGRHDDAAKARHNTLTMLSTAIRTNTLDEVLRAYGVMLNPPLGDSATPATSAA